jgi:PAS domain S-box-containing protein
LEEARLRAVVQLNKTQVSSDREFMDLALKESLALTSSTCGFLALLSEDGTSLTIPSWTQPEGREGLIANRALVCSVVSADSWADAVRIGEITITNKSVGIDPLKRGFPGGHAPILRQMSVPVFSDEKVMAVAGVANKTTPYTPEDANQLYLLMQEVWPLVQRRRDRSALEESEKRYRLLVESMNEGLGAFDQNCNVTFANERFCRMLGYAKHELVGKSAAAFLDESDQDIFYDRIAHNKDEGFRPYEVVWKTKQGTDLPAIVSPQALFDVTGNFVGSFAVVTDISRLKETEEELLTTNAKLQAEHIALQEKNVALREVMSQIDNERKLLKRQLQTNVDRILTPIITKLQKRSSRRNDHDLTLLKTCLDDIAAPFVNELDRRFDRLSPRELEICNLIKSGLSTTAIAGTLSTSVHTVNNQRKKIRRKLKLVGESSNLKVFLQSV